MRAIPRLWLAALLAGLGGALSSQAQDIIVHTDSSRIAAKVVEVRGQDVFYQPWTQVDSVMTVLAAHSVAAIWYANGARRNFSSAPGPDRWPLKFDGIEKWNVLSVRPLDLIFNNLTLSYEWLLRQGKVGLKVPLTLGLSHDRWDCYKETSTFYQSNKIFSTGLEVNFYSKPQDGLRFFWGPALQFGAFWYPYFEPDPFSFIFFTLPSERVKQGYHVAVVAQSGLLYQASKHFVMGFDVGVGWQTKRIDRTGPNHYSDQLDRHQIRVSGNVNLGLTL